MAKKYHILLFVVAITGWLLFGLQWREHNREQANINLVRTVYSDIINKKQLGTEFDQAFSNFDGKLALKAHLKRLYDAFPDFHGRVMNIMASHDEVMATVLWSGTFSPTGKFISGMTTEFYGFISGKLASRLILSDEFSSKVPSSKKDTLHEK